MDAAGTIVGVLSLGITLCDGLITYCRAWKHQDDDIQSLSNLVVSLKDLLQDIEFRLQATSDLDPNLVGRLQSCVTACSKHIEMAIRLSNRYSPTQTIGPKAKLKELIQRLRFPFEKKTLEELRGIVIAFRGNVDTALQLVNMDLAVSGSKGIQKLENTNNANQKSILSAVEKTRLDVTASFTGEWNKTLLDVKGHLRTALDDSTASIKQHVSQSSFDIAAHVHATKYAHDKQLLLLEAQANQLKAIHDTLSLVDEKAKE